MTDKPDVESLSIPAAEAIFNLLGCPEAPCNRVGGCKELCDAARLAGLHATRAALRAAAADGFRLVRVPDEKPGQDLANGEYWRGVYAGWNACRAATLASAVEVGE